MMKIYIVFFEKIIHTEERGDIKQAHIMAAFDNQRGAEDYSNFLGYHNTKVTMMIVHKEFKNETLPN